MTVRPSSQASECVRLTKPSRGDPEPVDLDQLTTTQHDHGPCPGCGRSPQRHALYYLPASHEWHGRRDCKSIDDIEARWAQRRPRTMGDTQHLAVAFTTGAGAAVVLLGGAWLLAGGLGMLAAVVLLLGVCAGGLWSAHRGAQLDPEPDTPPGGHGPPDPRDWGPEWRPGGQP